MISDGDLAAAARHYEHALALEPANTDIIGNAASLAANLGRLDTAIALHEYAIARDPRRSALAARTASDAPEGAAPGPS